MMKAPHLVHALESAEQATVDGERSYAEALAVFAALWAQARRLNPTIGDDWLDDVQADIAVARALRGLPPAR